jgi:hypothetical protein
MVSTEDHVAGILSRAPVPTPEQLARVAAILLPVPDSVPELVGAR